MAEPKTKYLSDSEFQKLYQLAKKTQWQYQLSQYETEALKEIQKSVNRARKEIGQKLSTIKPTSKFTKDRLEALGKELQDLTVGIQAQITGDVTQIATIAGVESYTKQSAIMSFDGMVPGFNAVSLSAAQVASMVSETPVGGYLLNEWVERSFSTRLQDQFKSEIMTGMLKGEGYPALVKRFQSGAFAGLQGDMETLTRSYVQTINVQAMQDVAEANDDIIKGWQWSSATENGSVATGRGICIQCLSLDSRDEVYPLKGGPQIPAHPRCRCVKLYQTKTFREMGVDIDELKSANRPYTLRGAGIDPETGEIFPQKVGTGGRKILGVGQYSGKYEDWLKTQSEAIQRQTLGPGRFELWKSGTPLGKMTDANGRMLLIKEMEGGVAKQAVKRAAFVEAKTIKEAEEWAMKNLNIKYANFKGLDIAVVNDINKSVFNIKGVMPDVETFGIGSAQQANKAIKAELVQAYKSSEAYTARLEGFGKDYADDAAKLFASRNVSNVGPKTIAWSTNVDIVKVPGGEHAVVDLTKYKGVYVNEKFGKDAKKLNELIQRNAEQRWFTEGANDFGYIMSHEIGHEIDKTIGFANSDVFKEIYKRENGMGVASVTSRLSNYGATAGGMASHKPMEMIAEGWAEFMTSQSPRELASEIGNAMLEYYYKKRATDIGMSFEKWKTKTMEAMTK